uniref:Activin_recp domain-containing protein n=1 Tax=Strongyloides venezuelensis TaxID=75913 RepID=A0A0K0EW69_STRVS
MKTIIRTAAILILFVFQPVVSLTCYEGIQLPGMFYSLKKQCKSEKHCIVFLTGIENPKLKGVSMCATTNICTSDGYGEVEESKDSYYCCSTDLCNLIKNDITTLKNDDKLKLEEVLGKEGDVSKIDVNSH